MTHGRRLNALSSDLVGELLAAIAQAKAAGARAFILRSEPGTTTWSAGHDVAELPTDGADPLLWNAPLEQLLRAVRTSPFPVIAAVEGGVWGGACDLAFTCDLVVATESSTFAITPAKMGVPYNTAGVTHFLGVLPLHIIKEMFFTAQPISARTAAQHGLVNRVCVDRAELDAAAGALADRICEMAPLVIQAVKAELTALTEASPMTPNVFEELTSLRRTAWTSADYAEGLASFYEKRPPRFTGS